MERPETVVLSETIQPVEQEASRFATPEPPALTPTPAPTPVDASAPTPTPAEPPSTDPTPVVPSAAPDPVATVLLEIVAEKTGYPMEMLSLEMGLDADLGIDSIKRVEILSAG